MTKRERFVIAKIDHLTWARYMSIELQLPNLEQDDCGPCLPDGKARIVFEHYKRDAYRFNRRDLRGLFPSVNIDALQSGDVIPGFRLVLLKM